MNHGWLFCKIVAEEPVVEVVKILFAVAVDRDSDDWLGSHCCYGHMLEEVSVYISRW